MMKSQRLRGPARSIRIGAGYCSAMIGALVAAQAASGQEATTPAAVTLTEVVVTGSRIRGTAPVGSTVVAVDRADIDTAAVVNTTQLIQEVPQVFNLGISENSRGQSGGNSNITLGSAVNLRGLGPFATLTLVDGHRAVPQGTSGLAVDPAAIPMLALERVEIVADGASAIYGSDAVAGVANLILRRNVEGFEFRGRYGFADEADENQIGVLYGHTWSSGQVTIAAEHQFRSALNGEDRDFFRADLRDEGGRDYLRAVEEELRNRRQSRAVRLEIEQGASDELRGLLAARLELGEADVYPAPGPLDVRVLLLAVLAHQV